MNMRISAGFKLLSMLSCFKDVEGVNIALPNETLETLIKNYCRYSILSITSATMTAVLIVESPVCETWSERSNV
jgi:hypothetical protein